MKTVLAVAVILASFAVKPANAQPCYKAFSNDTIDNCIWQQHD